MRRAAAHLVRRVLEPGLRSSPAPTRGPSPRRGYRGTGGWTGTARSGSWSAPLLAAGASLGLLGVYGATHPGPAWAKSAADLPTYTPEEVSKHRTVEERVWVTYKDGVYDVTDWLDIHPGGKPRLMLAAGGAIDPFWAMYQQHNTPEVRGILEGYRIGNLAGGPPPPAADPYADEPTDRLAALVVRSARPMNAEPPRELLAGSVITPTELFYIRNHLPVPRLDPATHRVAVSGEGVQELELSVDDLRRRFRKHSVVATVQCSGNRRNEFYGVKEVKGLEWGGAAIGTAVWGGARLADVLRAAGLDASDPGVAHVQFQGADTDGAGVYYGASIPLHRALDPRGDVLLAYEMNGKPLTRDHGAPVRVVVPGTAGCRSVKWVRKRDPERRGVCGGGVLSGVGGWVGSCSLGVISACACSRIGFWGPRGCRVLQIPPSRHPSLIQRLPLPEQQHTQPHSLPSPPPPLHPPTHS